MESEKEIPEDAIRPIKDLKKRIMLCQAFAMTRREDATVAMLNEDHHKFLYLKLLIDLFLQML